LEQRLQKITEKLAQLEPGAKRTGAAVTFFGKSGAALLPVIDEVGGNLDALKQRAEKLGIALNEDAVQAAKNLQRSLVTLRAEAEGMAAQFMQGLAPQLTNAVEAIAEQVSAGGVSGFKKLGEYAGKWINEKLGGTATIMCFNQTETEATLQRYNGIVDGVKSVIDESKITWLEPFSTTDTATAMAQMETILQAHPEVQVVLGSSDSAAVGAYQAVTSSSLNLDNFFIGGCDGISEALQYVSEGTIYRVSIANSKLTEDMGFEVVQNVVKAVAGLNYDAPYKAEVMTVDNSNVADYLARQPGYTLDSELAAYLGIN
jgi:ribose transport system substrate-binding protein